MGPVWDFDLGGGNADYAGASDIEGWYTREGVWFKRLFEDPEFVKETQKRWKEIYSVYFPQMIKRIDSEANRIKSSAEMNFGKWKILGVYVWPNAGDVRSRKTYQSEISYLKEWLTARAEWINDNI
ncbi:hypothetical protein FACS1894105_14310 [Clostridia bacterium]|nr:hypothetical protein FACS1894105_14310 [Clostridia bacterium]